MAVLARSSITLVTSVDIDSVYWFYILQASTAAAPAKPTTVPATKGNAPSGWSTAEPTTVDINKTLYRVELTYFTDGTGVYSSVNKVSSYEAAKVAYNKANDVQTNLDDAYDKLQSMGEQLVVNGSAFTGDNTNFSTWTFDGSVANGTKGSFTKPSNYAGTPMTDETFPIDITKRYRFEFDAKSKNKTAKHYSFLNFYDVDGNTIQAYHHMFIANTLTTLAQDLKNGDTVVYLTDLTNWKTSTGSATHQRGLTFWNYTNSFGYTYPELTYTRNVWTNLYTDANVNKTAKTITLSSAWNHGTFPAGTKVSQSNSGANYKYNPWSNSLCETTWTHYVGYYDGTDYSGNNVQTKFPPGAATAKVGFLWNYQSQSTTDQLWITNVSVMEDVKTSISNAQTTANNAATAASTAQTTANNAATAASTAQTTANNAATAASTAQATADEAKTAATNATNTANGAKSTADDALINTKYNVAIKAGAAISANKLIMDTNQTANAASSYKMVAQNTAYNIESPILFTKAAISSGGSSSDCYHIGKVAAVSGMTVNKPVFLKGTLDGKKFTTVNTSAYITQTEPISSDTYHYIYLGTAASATEILLQAEHPIYMFTGGSFHRIGLSSDKIIQEWVGGASVAIADAKLNGSYIQAETISGTHIIGEDLSAIKAKIGGFALESNSIHTSGVEITSNAQNSVGLSSVDFARTINGTSRSGLRLAIGSKFGVSNAGVVYAAEAIISGTITATAGAIGGFTIDSNSIHTTSTSSNSTTANAVWLSSSTFSRAIGGTTRSNLKFAIGGSFAIDKDGGFYASSGVVGRWTLGATSTTTSSNAQTNGTLYSGTFGSANSIYLIPSGTTASKTIGGKTGTDWRITVADKFGVNSSGEMYASTFRTSNNIGKLSGDQKVLLNRWDHLVVICLNGATPSEMTINQENFQGAFKPVQQVWFPVTVKDDQNKWHVGTVGIDTSGTWVLYVYYDYNNTNQANWTNASCSIFGTATYMTNATTYPTNLF